MVTNGNQTILVWYALASGRRHIRDMGPELEALVTIAAPHKSAMNLFFLKKMLHPQRFGEYTGTSFFFKHIRLTAPACRIPVLLEDTFAML